jgi:hypothetical protein
MNGQGGGWMGESGQNLLGQLDLNLGDMSEGMGHRGSPEFQGTESIPYRYSGRNTMGYADADGNTLEAGSPEWLQEWLNSELGGTSGGTGSGDAPAGPMGGYVNPTQTYTGHTGYVREGDGDGNFTNTPTGGGIAIPRRDMAPEERILNRPDLQGSNREAFQAGQFASTPQNPIAPAPNPTAEANARAQSLRDFDENQQRMASQPQPQPQPQPTRQPQRVMSNPMPRTQGSI